MSSSYTGNAGNVTAGANPVITIPSDGDVLTAASASTPEDALADFAAYLDKMMVLNAALNLSPSFALPLIPGGVSWGRPLCATGLSGIRSAQWVVVGASGAGYSSSSGLLGGGWTSRTMNVGTAALYSVQSNGSLLVAVGAPNAAVAAVTTSPDGVTWTLRTTGLGNTTLNDVAWSPTLSLWCAVGNSGSVYTSPDGITWTSRSAGAGSFFGITWAPGPGLFLAQGTGSSYYTSPDGVTWTSRTFPITITAGSWCAGNGLVLAQDLNSANVYTSTDGINWTARAVSGSGGSSIGGPIAWNGKIFVMGCPGQDQGSISTSFDGITWKARTPVAIQAALKFSGWAAHANGSIVWTQQTLGSANAAVSAAWQTP